MSKLENFYELETLRKNVHTAQTQGDNIPF